MTTFHHSSGVTGGSRQLGRPYSTPVGICITESDAAPRNEERVLSDQILLEQTRAGSQEALGQLISRHYRTCFHVASAILHDRISAQDAVQDAMWGALTHLDQYRQEAPFSAWLTRIVVNYCLMQLRARKRVQWVSFDTDGPDGPLPRLLRDGSLDPERQLIDRECYEIVKKEIQLLPPLFRNVILLHDVHELPLAEIAQRLQITVSAIRGRLLRARIELKKRVAHRHGWGALSKLSTKGQNAGEYREPAATTNRRKAEGLKCEDRHKEISQ